MKPIIKYRGGKSSEIKYILPHIPNHYERYIEPFVGGGALFFHLAHSPSIINDVNSKLMHFYKQLRDNYFEVRQQLDKLQQIYEKNQTIYEENKKASTENYVENANEALYYELRGVYNYPNKEWLEAVVYYFINKTAYSGMLRFNKSGEYNVPFGRYRNFNTNIITYEHSKLLQQAELYNTDFSNVFNLSCHSDFIFLDPPYDTVFNDYGNISSADGFSEADHRRLAQEFRNLPCKTLMVIGDTGFIQGLYKGYIIDSYEKKYAVNIRNRFNNEARHLIIKNYDLSVSIPVAIELKKA